MSKKKDIKKIFKQGRKAFWVSSKEEQLGILKATCSTVKDILEATK